MKNLLLKAAACLVGGIIAGGVVVVETIVFPDNGKKETPEKAKKAKSAPRLISC